MQKELYLITGFLGAGKTTLIKNLLHIFSDRKIAVIVNEFGQQGVDGILLSNEGIQVTEINNGSIFCVCRSDLFVDALLQVLKTDAEVLLVETSGLSDPAGMEKILSITKCDYNYRGAIAVVDASNVLKLINTAAAVSAQISSSQLVLINKSDLAEDENLQKIEQDIRKLNPSAVIKRTKYSKVNPEWIASLTPLTGNEGLIKKKTVGIQKLLINLSGIYKKEEIERWIACFSEDSYRIKGFINMTDGWCYVDGTGERVTINPGDMVHDKSYLIVLALGDRPVKRKIIEGSEKYLQEPITIL